MSQSSSCFLETADRIGCRLCRDALWDGPRCNWLGWSRELINRAVGPVYRSFGPELYEGVAGIALFLGRLYPYTKDPLQKKTLEGAIQHVSDRIVHGDDSTNMGFYTGWSGMAYALIEVGRILENDALIDRGITALGGLEDAQEDGRMVGVMDGCAGVIPALIDIAQRFHREELIGVAVQYGTDIVDQAAKSDAGWSWETLSIPEGRHLTGYAHGVAGIACALLELHRVTGEERFREAAMEGLRYERGAFCAAQGNWPDFRKAAEFDSPLNPICTMAWCHGAPGIGISRLRMLRLMEEDDKLLNEVDVAIHSTVAALQDPVLPGRGNYSLCHGSGGNCELLMLAADQMSRLDLRRKAEQVGLHGVEQFERQNRPWPCGVEGAGETPALMLGSAGIGYYYLRLHDPDAVPSVLIIMPQ